MSYPKIAACPACGNPGDQLNVYTYDNGWRHVECDKCYYLGPGEGNIKQAIQSHNRRASEKALAPLPPAGEAAS